MPYTYQVRNGIEYGTFNGKSVRNGKTVSKDFQLYLGRVIDKENHIFFNRKNGTFRFDEDTRSFLPADPGYSSELKSDGRKKERMVLDFGDSYFLSKLLENMQYQKVIDSIDYGNRDTVNAMVLFYTMTDYACSHAQTWYDGNFAKVLYPNANLTSQRLSEFMHKLGDEYYQRQYFKSHIEWLRKRYATIMLSLSTVRAFPTPLTLILLISVTITGRSVVKYA